MRYSASPRRSVCQMTAPTAGTGLMGRPRMGCVRSRRIRVAATATFPNNRGVREERQRRDGKET